MAYQLLDFSDLLDYCVAELGLQSSDTTSIVKLKRIMNACYMNEVVPFKRWKWLQGHTKVVHKAVYHTGTASVSGSSTSVTLSSAPALGFGSFAGYNFAVDGFDEIYTISAHTANTTAITLTSEYQSATDSAVSYKIWKDVINLPTDCRETVELWHNRDQGLGVMKTMGWQDLREEVANDPRLEGFPEFYNTIDFYDPTSGDAETESDRYRQARIYPAITRENVTINVDYIKEVSPLNSDSDEPLMAIEERLVLCYGTLKTAWRTLKRSESDALINERLFKETLARMAGHIEDSFDIPRLQPSTKYIRASRQRIGRAAIQSSFGGNSANNSDITYLENITLNAGQITGNFTVSSGITVDGRDISVDGADLDAHIASTAAHGATGAVVGTTNTQTLTNKSIDADTNTITNIENADIKAAAGIVYSKLNLASSIVNTDVAAAAAIDATKIANGSVSSTEFQYLDGVTSAIQTQLDAKQPIDSDLTAVAGLSSNGIIARTGTGTASVRTVTAGSSKISVTNGDGVSGNPTVDVTEANLSHANIGGVTPIAGGGTNNGSLAVTAGGVVGTDGSKLVNSGAGTSGMPLRSAGSGTAAFAFGVSQAKTANYTAATNDTLIKVDSSGGAFDITLPTAVGIDGKEYVIIATAVGSNAGVSLKTTSSQTIGGLASANIILNTAKDSIRVVSDGANWQIASWEITVGAFYTGRPTGTIDGATDNIYPTKVTDPNTDYATGSGTYTARYAGKYTINIMASIAVTTGSFTSVTLRKNGSNIYSKTFPWSATLTNNLPATMDLNQVALAAGDTLTIRFGGNGSPTFENTASVHWLCVTRTGN